MESLGVTSGGGWGVRARIAGVGSIGMLLAVAAANRNARVEVFAADWATVDRVRAEAEALGLGDRVHVHHEASARVAGGRA